MLKKIPMGMAALTFFAAKDSQAIKLRAEWNPDLSDKANLLTGAKIRSSKRNHQAKQSPVPNCNSATHPDCVKDQRHAGPDDLYDSEMDINSTIAKRPNLKKPKAKETKANPAPALDNQGPMGSLAQKATKQKASIVSKPACTSADYPDCIDEAKTAGPAAWKGMIKGLSLASLQLDTVNDKSGSDHKKALVQLKKTAKSPVPACNSTTRPDCVTKATSAAPPSIQEDMRHPIDNHTEKNYRQHPDQVTPPEVVQDKVQLQEQVSEGVIQHAQVESVPACNSHTHPGCKEAKTAADEAIAENMRRPLDTVDPRFPNKDFGYAQRQSVPACNSATHPDCVKDAKTVAAPWVHDDLRDIMNQHQEHLWYHAQIKSVKGSKAKGKSASDPTDPLTPEQLGDYEVDKLDGDIQDSLNHLKNTETKLGGKLTIPKAPTPPPEKTKTGEDEKKKEETPTVVEKLQTKNEVNLNSDPNYNSHEGYQTREFQGNREPDGSETEYPDGDLDHDIAASQESLHSTEKTLGKKMKLQGVDDEKKTKKDEKEKPKDQAKLMTQNSSDPSLSSEGGYMTGHYEGEGEEAGGVKYTPLDHPLDDEVQDTRSNLIHAESSLGKKMQIVQLGSSSGTKTAVKSAKKAKKNNKQSLVQTKQKSKAKAKTKAQTRTQRASDLTTLRKQMMSNWGTL